MIKLGAHVQFTKGKNYLLGAVNDSLAYGANAMMIFVGPPQNAKRMPVSSFHIDTYLGSSLKKAILPENIVVHAPYIVNLANPRDEDFVVDFLAGEIQVATTIGCHYYVVHPGSAAGIPREEAIKKCAAVIQRVLERTQFVSIAIETMAGKGQEIGSNFTEMKQILANVNSERVGVCIDTCHLWDAGYDLNQLDTILEEFDRVVGLNRLHVAHVNDSKNPLGTHRDRHANVGKGYIGLEILRAFVHHPRLTNVIKVLETPWVNKKPIYKEEIALLR